MGELGAIAERKALQLRRHSLPQWLRQRRPSARRQSSILALSMD
jgi:hypothetical protein